MVQMYNIYFFAQKKTISLNKTLSNVLKNNNNSKLYFTYCFDAWKPFVFNPKE